MAFFSLPVGEQLLMRYPTISGLRDQLMRSEKRSAFTDILLRSKATVDSGHVPNVRHQMVLAWIVVSCVFACLSLARRLYLTCPCQPCQSPSYLQAFRGYPQETERRRRKSVPQNMRAAPQKVTKWPNRGAR